MKAQTRVQITSRPGTFFVVSCNWGKLHLMDQNGVEFNVPENELITKEDVKEHKERLQRLKPITPPHLRPTRVSVVTDLHWQAFLRRHGFICVCTPEKHLYNALDMIEERSGIRYEPNASGIILSTKQWASSFRISWSKSLGIPFDMVRRPTNSGTTHYYLAGNEFVLDLLGLGFQFGGAPQEVGLDEKDLQVVPEVSESNPPTISQG